MIRSLAAGVLLAASALLPATPASAAPVVPEDFPTGGARATINVSTAAQLKTALTDARPGDTIKLADGTYTGNFKTTVDGTSSAPITLTGSSGAVLKASGGYGLHLNGASYRHPSHLTRPPRYPGRPARRPGYGPADPPHQPGRLCPAVSGRGSVYEEAEFGFGFFVYGCVDGGAEGA